MMGFSIFFACLNALIIGTVVGGVIVTDGTFTLGQLAIILINAASLAVQVNTIMKYKA
jgi:hypothetical protein